MGHIDTAVMCSPNTGRSLEFQKLMVKAERLAYINKLMREMLEFQRDHMQGGKVPFPSFVYEEVLLNS